MSQASVATDPWDPLDLIRKVRALSGLLIDLPAATDLARRLDAAYTSSRISIEGRDVVTGLREGASVSPAELQSVQLP